MRTCFAARRNERGLGINEETALLPPWQWRFEADKMQSRFASSFDMGPCQPARFWKKSLVYYLKAVALRGGKRRRGERSLVAAALSKLDAGVAFFFLYPVYYPRNSLALPPSSNSDLGSHSGCSSSLPTSARAFIFIARRTQHFLPSSTRVELYLLTLLGALSSYPLFFACLQIKSNLIMVGIELKNKQTLVVFEGKTTRPPGRPADN